MAEPTQLEWLTLPAILIFISAVGCVCYWLHRRGKKKLETALAKCASDLEHWKKMHNYERRDSIKDRNVKTASKPR